MLKKMFLSLSLMLLLAGSPAQAAQWIPWPAPDTSNGEQPRFNRFFDKETVRILYKDGEVQSIYFWCKNVPVAESKLDYFITLNCINITHQGETDTNTAEYFSPFVVQAKDGQSIANQHDTWTFFGENNGTTLKGIDKIFEELQSDTDEAKRNRVIDHPLDVQSESLPQSVMN